MIMPQSILPSIQIALKISDLGHLASSLEVHKKWVALLEEEMFRQGDQERAMGQPISPLMDRNKIGVTKSQTGFFNVVAVPLYRAFAEAFPGTSELLDNLNVNLDVWSKIEAEAAR